MIHGKDYEERRQLRREVMREKVEAASCCGVLVNFLGCLEARKASILHSRRGAKEHSLVTRLLPAPGQPLASTAMGG